MAGRKHKIVGGVTMPESPKYKNWKVVTEADFVSLFIKTWFVYISTLRVMFPEAQNRRGDGKYLNAYKAYYQKDGRKHFVIDDKIMSSIETVYREGRKIIMSQYPEYYFWDFYHVNEDFKYTFKDIPPDKSESLIFGLKLYRNRGTKWSFIFSGFVSFFGKYYGIDYKGHIPFQCNISDILNESKETIKDNSSISEQDYLSWLLQKISEEVSHSFVQAFVPYYEQCGYGQRQRMKIHDLEKRALSIIWSVFSLNGKDDSYKIKEEMERLRNTYEVIQQMPINYFEYHMDIDLQPQNRDLSASEEEWFKKLYKTRNQNSIIWFLSFVYRLRNALFHEIIDPLNEEWQIVFKNAYLVLKEIVDLNIQIIDEKKEELTS